MKIIRTRQEMQNMVHLEQKKGKSIGFVPTMGYLHKGHLSLIKRAQQENDSVVVSIFVNPKQFAPEEDFKSYPRDLEHDQKMVEAYTDYLFYPDEKEIYSPDEKISFTIKDITQCLCGLSRPHHFPGVCLVVAKLFQMIRPERTYFGQKDYQQTVVVRHLIEELFFPIELVICPTVRENDGLAMSSRNIHLSTTERSKAKFLYQSLQYGVNLLQADEKKSNMIIQKIKEFLEQKDINHIDYIDIRESHSLKKVITIKKEPIVIALAVFFHKARLIDNILYHPR